jgi:energy-coupling factor transporter ATP-binding protein EcfA2
MPEPDCHLYRLFGLTVASSVPLPVRTVIQSKKHVVIDARIEIASVPSQLDGAKHQGPCWSVTDRQFLLDLPDAGRFLAVDGDRILLSPAPGVPLDDVLVYVTGTMMAAIAYQRGAMLLHASAVVRNGRALLVCGRSGLGKSTLAAALCRAGCAFLSDDVSTIAQVDAGPIVHSDGRTIRLYPDSIARLALTDEIGAPVVSFMDKFHVAPPAEWQQAETTIPLGAIYLLTDAKAACQTRITPMPMVDAAQCLMLHSYRRRLAMIHRDIGSPTERIAGILRHVGVSTLQRPRELNRIDSVADDILAHFDQLAPTRRP